MGFDGNQYGDSYDSGYDWDFFPGYRFHRHHRHHHHRRYWQPF